MGIFGPSRRQRAQWAQWERELHATKVSKYSNPPKKPLPEGIEWIVFNGQYSGSLGILKAAPVLPGESMTDGVLAKTLPRISVFIDGTVLRDAFDDGWIRKAIQSERYLSDIERKLPKGSLLFHYYFLLDGDDVSAENAVECVTVLWPKFLENNTWDAFRKALHAGELPGAPEWWRSATLS